MRVFAIHTLPSVQADGSALLSETTKEVRRAWSDEEEEDEEAGVAQAAVEVPAEQQHASTQHLK